MKTLLVSLLLLSVFARSAAAQSNQTGAGGIPKYITDGNSLYSICTANTRDEITNIASEGSCLGFVNGVALTLDALGMAHIPDGVTQGQTQDVVVKYLRDNPATRNEPAVGLTIKAVEAAFPKQN